MEASLSQRGLAAIRAVKISRIVLAVDHMGYHHSPYDWWVFDARMTSPKTCEICKVLDRRTYRGDWIPERFPFHIHRSVNAIKAMVHLHCRCILRWAGRAEGIYASPTGILPPEQIAEMWYPSEKELERLSPSQLKAIFEFLREPYRG